MRLTYYGYNAFVIEGEGKTLIIDPGQHLHWRRLDPLIPQQRWGWVDLILVTHGDPDHAEYVLQVARSSGAPVVCGLALAKKWRRKGLTVVSMDPGGTTEVAGINIQAFPAKHGPVPHVCGRSINLKPWFVGVGAMSLLFTLENRRLLNLGDTVLLDEWRGFKPDVLMIPIGGLMTMDVDDALKAVTAIEPEVVIPAHHNWDFLFYHLPADEKRFAAEVKAGGRRCLLLEPGESAEV
jgi:L-ascorbate metabolism protein UlaG (beta-lactamase superfamily)